MGSFSNVVAERSYIVKKVIDLMSKAAIFAPIEYVLYTLTKAIGVTNHTTRRNLGGECASFAVSG